MNMDWMATICELLACVFLAVLGIILLIIGIVLELMGTAGHAVRGRRHYY